MKRIFLSVIALAGLAIATVAGAAAQTVPHDLGISFEQPADHAMIAPDIAVLASVIEIRSTIEPRRHEHTLSCGHDAFSQIAADHMSAIAIGYPLRI